jgi:transaldolase
MPEETIEPSRTTARSRRRSSRARRGAQALRRLEAAGVSVDDVTRVLEEEGVQKFSDSFAELLDGIRAKRGELVSA